MNTTAKNLADLHLLLTNHAVHVITLPRPRSLGGVDIALIVDGGYSQPWGEDMAAWYAKTLRSQGVPANYQPPRRTT